MQPPFFPPSQVQGGLEKKDITALLTRAAELAEEAVSRYARSVDEHVRNPQGFMVRRAGWLPPAVLLSCIGCSWLQTRRVRNPQGFAVRRASQLCQPLS